MGRWVCVFEMEGQGQWGDRRGAAEKTVARREASLGGRGGKGKVRGDRPGSIPRRGTLFPAAFGRKDCAKSAWRVWNRSMQSTMDGEPCRTLFVCPHSWCTLGNVPSEETILEHPWKCWSCCCCCCCCFWHFFPPFFRIYPVTHTCLVFFSLSVDALRFAVFSAAFLRS